MRNKILFISLSVLIIAFLIGYFSVDYSIQKDTVPNEELTIVSEFPSPDVEVYTNNILKTVQSEDYLYLLEHRGGYFLQFDHEGKFIQKIGRSGRGPGELINPLDLVYSDGKLYTLEQGKMQVQVFSEQGDHIDTFMFHGAYNGLVVVNNKFLLRNYYYQGMPDYVDMPGREGNPIFTEYDFERDSTQPFGYYPDFVQQLGIKTSPAITSVFGNKIYVGYRAFPFVQVYSSSGTLEKEISLKGNGFEKVIPRYLEEVPGEYMTIFMDMEVNEKGLFFSTYSEEEKMEFFQFDFSGELISQLSLADYYHSEYRDLYIRNFTMIPSYKEGKSRLFLTIQGEYPRGLIVDKQL